MATELQRAWLAGFFDGEGCICLVVVKKTGTIMPKAFLVNTNADAFEEARRITQDILGREVFWELQRGNDRQGYRPCYRVRMRSMAEIKKLLEALLPYLVAKRPQAALMLYYLSIAPGKNGRFSAKHYEVVAKMGQLNRRFKKGEWWSVPLSERLDGQPLEFVSRVMAKSELHGDVQRAAETTAPALIN